MTQQRHLALTLLCCLASAAALAGCTNPDAPAAHETADAAPQNAGEPPAPAPPSAAAQAPAAVKATPVQAIEAFARLYTNWTYRTLSREQQTLASMSVGAARLAERQAAVSSNADTTIARGHIYNTGQTVSITRELTDRNTWVIVTREHTGGNSEYEGLTAAYHVTLAKLAKLPTGYVIESWLPQD